MQNICNRDCWILLFPKLNSSLRTSPEPYFRLIQAFNWSKNNFGESHISQGLNRLGVTLSTPLFSPGATSLSPYEGLNYLCHHRPQSIDALWKQLEWHVSEGLWYKFVWDCENMSSPKGIRQPLWFFPFCAYVHIIMITIKLMKTRAQIYFFLKSSCKLISQQGTSSVLVHRPLIWPVVMMAWKENAMW